MPETISSKEQKKTIQRSAARTAVLMAVLTLVSKVFGFVREMVLAACFGTGYVVDAYVMAQNIPNMLFAGVLGAVSISFMPLYSDRAEKEGEASADAFVNDIRNLLLKAALVVTVIGVAFTPQFVRLFASGFSGQQAALTVFFLRITFCALAFTSLNLLLTAYLHYKGIFLQPIIFGYVQNFCIIVFTVLAVQKF